MAKRPPEPVSVDRRSFFRQLLASALDTVEKTGREMAKRASLPLEQFATPQASAAYATHSHDHHPSPYSWQVLGPPWPPPLGPPVPIALQMKLRADRQLGSEGTVSRAAEAEFVNPESAEADRAAQSTAAPAPPRTQRLEP